MAQNKLFHGKLKIEPERSFRGLSVKPVSNCGKQDIGQPGCQKRGQTGVGGENGGKPV